MHGTGARRPRADGYVPATAGGAAAAGALPAGALAGPPLAAGYRELPPGSGLATRAARSASGSPPCAKKVCSWEGRGGQGTGSLLRCGRFRPGGSRRLGTAAHRRRRQHPSAPEPTSLRARRSTRSGRGQHPPPARRAPLPQSAAAASPCRQPPAPASRGSTCGGRKEPGEQAHWAHMQRHPRSSRQLLTQLLPAGAAPVFLRRTRAERRRRGSTRAPHSECSLVRKLRVAARHRQGHGGRLDGRQARDQGQVVPWVQDGGVVQAAGRGGGRGTGRE